MQSHSVRTMNLNGAHKKEDVIVYCVIKVGDKYYSGLSPTGRIMMGSSPTDARILDYKDTEGVLKLLGRGTICKVEFKDVESPQAPPAGDVEQFIAYAESYGYTVSYTMASYAVAACGTNHSACLAWTQKLNEAIMPAVQAVCGKVSTTPEAACEQLLIGGPTDRDGFKTRVARVCMELRS